MGIQTVIYHILLGTPIERRTDEHRTSRRARQYKKVPVRAEEEITEAKNTLEAINSWLDDTGAGINDLENRVVEITQTVLQKEKRILKNEDSLRGFWDNMKQTSIHILGVQKEKRKRERAEDSSGEGVALKTSLTGGRKHTFGSWKYREFQTR